MPGTGRMAGLVALRSPDGYEAQQRVHEIHLVELRFVEVATKTASSMFRVFIFHDYLTAGAPKRPIC